MNNTDLSNEASFATLSCQYVLSKCTLKVITRICTEKTHEATPISVQFYLRNLKKNKTTPEIIIVVTKNKEMKKNKATAYYYYLLLALFCSLENC